MRTELEKYLIGFYNSQWSKGLQKIAYEDFMGFWLADADLVRLWAEGHSAKLKLTQTSVRCVHHSVDALLIIGPDKNIRKLPKTHKLCFSPLAVRKYWEKLDKHPSRI